MRAAVAGLQRPIAVPSGQAEGGFHPVLVGCPALRVLPVSLRPAAKSVVAAHHVQGDEQDARQAPAAVLPEAGKGGRAALTFQLEGGLPPRSGQVG